MSNRLNRSRLAVLAAAALLGAGAPLAVAQQRLSDDVVTRSSLTAADQQAIEAYVDAVAPGLLEDDEDARREARRSVIDPLLGAVTPTPGFRIKYASELMPTLRRLMGDGQAGGSVAALTIIGPLATGEGLRMAVDAMAHEDPTVRFAAARAVRQSLDVVAEGPAAINEQQAGEAIDALVARLSVETNPAVLDGLLYVVSKAVEAEHPWRDRMVRGAATAVAERIDEVGEDPLASLRVGNRIVGASQRLFRDQLGDADRELGIPGALLAGHAMGHALDLLETRPDLDDRETAAAGQLLKAAHNLAFFAHAAATGQSLPANEDVPNAFDRWREGRGDLGALRGAVEAWIGPGGTLTRAPYDAVSGDFPAM